MLGWPLGAEDGTPVGILGAPVGSPLGLTVGTIVGTALGSPDGVILG